MYNVSDRMSLSLLLFISAVFLLGGGVKGVIGLGLPTISMGMLALAMPSAQAAALLVLPSLATNLRQGFDGPHVGMLLRRLWPMLIGILGGTMAGTGWLVDGDARLAGALLGAALAAYGVFGLAAPHLHLPRRHESWAGPLAGAATGLVAAATGVFVLPAVPYLQALDLDRDARKQALGLCLTTSALSLGLNLAAASALGDLFSLPVLLGVIAAAIGMALGLALQRRLSPAVFRRVFFAGLVLLGGVIVLRALG